MPTRAPGGAIVEEYFCSARNIFASARGAPVVAFSRPPQGSAPPRRAGRPWWHFCPALGQCPALARGALVVAFLPRPRAVPRPGAWGGVRGARGARGVTKRCRANFA